MASSGAVRLAESDYFAALIVAVGIAGQFLHRRLPYGLGTSLLGCGVTVGLGLTAYRHAPAGADWYYIGSHGMAALCVLWAIFGCFAARQRDGGGNARPPAGRDARPTPSSSSTFFAWSLVSGVASAALLGYMMLLEVSGRVMNPDMLEPSMIKPAGLWDLAGMCAAAGIWTLAGRRAMQPVTILAVVIVAASWISLLVPPAAGSYWRVIGPVTSFRPIWWSWTLQLQVGCAAIVVATTLIAEFRFRRRRARAWPARLADLIDGNPRWPGVMEVMCALAGGVLLLGVFQLLLQFGPFRWQLEASNAVAALTCGGTCLMQAHRRWSPLAALGLGLISLGAAAIAATLVPLAAATEARSEYAARMPVLFNSMLFALTVMAALWYWLGVFWQQQLHDGQAWTTAGRMIPTAQLVGFALLALGFVVAAQMALWPLRGTTRLADNSPARLVAGVSAIVLHVLLAARIARRTDSPTTAGLAVVLVLTVVGFLAVRWPDPESRGRVVQYAAVVGSAASIPILLIAELLPKSIWRSFAPPLWFLSLLVLPALSLGQLLHTGRLPTEWVRPATFFLLCALYALAGVREGRRAFLALSGVLLAVAGMSLWDLSKAS